VAAEWHRGRQVPGVAPFLHTLAATLKAAASAPSLVSSAAATFAAAGRAAQEAAAVAMGPRRGPAGFVKVGESKHLSYADDGSRFFMLGGDYFRGMFNSSLDPETLAIDLRNAVLSGLNVLRFYGFPAQLLQTSPATMALLRQMHADHGLRVLFTLPACESAILGTTPGKIPTVYI
jgi:hypothetical protein